MELSKFAVCLDREYGCSLINAPVEAVAWTMAQCVPAAEIDVTLAEVNKYRNGKPWIYRSMIAA